MLTCCGFPRIITVHTWAPLLLWNLALAALVFLSGARSDMPRVLACHMLLGGEGVPLSTAGYFSWAETGLNGGIVCRFSAARALPCHAGILALT